MILILHSAIVILYLIYILYSNQILLLGIQNSELMVILLACYIFSGFKIFNGIITCSITLQFIKIRKVLSHPRVKSSANRAMIIIMLFLIYIGMWNSLFFTELTQELKHAPSEYSIYHKIVGFTWKNCVYSAFVAYILSRLFSFYKS